MIILFLRCCEEVEKPFYTAEVTNKQMAKVRGSGNQEPTPDVEKFMTAWGQKVLHGREMEIEAA